MEAVQETTIHVIGAESFQLTGEHGIHIGPCLHHPRRQLGGEYYPVAVTAGKCLPHEGLTHTRSLEGGSVVGEGGVDVIDPVVDSVVQHPCREQGQ